MAERFGFETGKLVMSQFRSRTRIGRKKRLLEEAEKILRSGAVEQPKWFNALKTCAHSPMIRLPRERRRTSDESSERAHSPSLSIRSHPRARRLSETHTLSLVHSSGSPRLFPRQI
jgi:hypothetical protein